MFNLHIITGHIGSGKSSVSEELRSRGYSVIDLDSLTKDVVLTTPEIKAALTAKFGPSAVLPYVGISDSVRRIALDDKIVYDWIDGMLSVYLSEAVHRTCRFLSRTELPANLFIESAVVPQWMNERARGKVFRIVVSDKDTRIDRVVNRHKTAHRIETERTGFCCLSSEEYEKNKKYLEDYRQMIIKTDELQDRLDEEFEKFSARRPVKEFVNDNHDDFKKIATDILNYIMC